MDNPRSHQNFAASRFKPHGSVTVWPEGNVVYLDLEGPFNPEFFASLLILNDSLYTELAGKGPFVEIAIFRHSMLMSSDALSEFGSVLLDRKANDRAPLATAWVIDQNVDDAFIILPLAEKKFLEAERPFKVFAAIDDAETWAREFLIQDN
jgi:hypothetical protein